MKTHKTRGSYKNKIYKLLVGSSLLLGMTMSAQENKSSDIGFGDLFLDVKMQKISSDNKTIVDATPKNSPDVIFGDLFTDVQMQRIFPDNKTFVDAIPKKSPQEIMKAYKKEKNNKHFSLSKFVEKYFVTQKKITSPIQNRDSIEDINTHITLLWDHLKREPDVIVEGSSQLPLPFSYIVPGGRFREIYYWDTYFTMLGLEVSKKNDLIENMVNNFDFILKRYGHIPNGNRSYYLSRSQPPFFSLMVELLSGIKGDDVYKTYNEALQIEYDYWMDKSADTHHVVTTPNGLILNRYWDQSTTPRQESFYEDSVLVVGTEDRESLYRNLRSGAESGWDFSSRWMSDYKNLSSIRTTDLLPIDLNCLLFHLEKTLAYSYSELGDLNQSIKYTDLAKQRLDAINSLLYNPQEKWYYDYDILKDKQSDEKTIAGIVPFFIGIAPLNYIDGVAYNVEKYFLKPGGIVTSLKNSGQQWDAPNGWAPLQWMTIEGLRKYGETKLAQTVALRWINLNKKVYNATGKMMEKYNVEDMDLTAGGGEYPAQDGFGWSNGVFLRLAYDYEQ